MRKESAHDIKEAIAGSERSYQLVWQETPKKSGRYTKLALPRYKQWEFREEGVEVTLAHYGARVLDLGRRDTKPFFPPDDMIVGEIDFKPKRDRSWSRRLVDGMEGLGFLFCALDQRQEEGEIIPRLLLSNVSNADSRQRPRSFERLLERLGFSEFYSARAEDCAGYTHGLVASAATVRERLEGIRQELKAKHIGQKTVYDRLWERSFREYTRDGRDYYQDNLIQ